MEDQGYLKAGKVHSFGVDVLSPQPPEQGLAAKLTWRIDMLVYRLFCWRWSKILKRDPRMAYLFAEWTRRYTAERPIAMTAKIRINEMIDNYAVSEQNNSF